MNTIKELEPRLKRLADKFMILAARENVTVKEAVSLASSFYIVSGHELYKQLEPSAKMQFIEAHEKMLVSFETGEPA